MTKKFTLFVLLQVLVLAAIAVSYYAVGWYGEEVRLKTAPVDPRDLFYGDYVTLNYEISQIDRSKFAEEEEPERGDPVYVKLKKTGDYHELVSAHLEKPSVSPDERLLKGRVEYVTESENTSPASAHVVYGLERYYVPEGEGGELEEKTGQFDVVVKVAPWGQHISRLTFIANGVIPQSQAEERVYQYYDEQSVAIVIQRSRLVDHYQNQPRPVWLVEIVRYPDKKSEKGLPAVIAVDAKTGAILEEKSR